MCEEIEEMLAEGQKAAEAMIEHLKNSGASKISIPITNDDGCYQVTVIKTL